MSRYSLQIVWIETIISSMKKSGGVEDRESGDGGKSSSGSKRRRSDSDDNDKNGNNDDDDESKEVGKDDANDTTNQQKEGKESLLQLGTKITVRTKTHDGGSSSQVQVQSGAEEDNTTDETTNNRMDAFARYSDGTTRRTRVSTEQHISTFLEENNYQDEQSDTDR